MRTRVLPAAAGAKHTGAQTAQLEDDAAARRPAAVINHHRAAGPRRTSIGAGTFLRARGTWAAASLGLCGYVAASAAGYTYWN
jgi:hypothetical protein